MKLSFSLASSKPSSSSRAVARNGHGGEGEIASASRKVEFVTEFDPNASISAVSSIVSAIAPLPNTDSWRAPKRMKNLELDLDSNSSAVADRFELDSSQPDSGSVTYGLILRHAGNGSNAEVSVNFDSSDLGVRSEPALSAEQKLREDIEKLPEDRGFEEFEEIAVEDFSKALLAGYGWKTGQGIGRNAKEDTKVREYKRWVGNGGLGFKSDAPLEKEKKKGREDLLPVPPPASSRPVSDNGASEKLPIKTVRVISGEFAGQKAEVFQSLRRGEVNLRLLGSRAKVIVAEELIAEVGSAEEQRFLRKMDKSGRSEEQVKKNSKERVEGAEIGNGKRKREPISWLRSQIRVRVISKDIRRGRMYLKKGTVVDVVGPMTCDISMDESGELLQGVDQEMLETALPRRGGSVLVLFGRYKGCFGTLMEKNSEKETAVVRDADNHELIKVRLDQISEYVGDPSVLGY
ncbi:protein MOS2-like [Wolffia australiana]